MSKKIQDMTQEELQQMLDSYNQETGHIKEWMIDRAINYQFGARVRGDQLKTEDRSYLYTDDVNKRRNKSISKDRQKNPLNQNETWLNSMQKNEEWTQAIRDSRRVQTILQCDMDMTIIKEWPSYKVIEDNTPFTKSSIFKAVKGNMKRGNPHGAYGYLWWNKDDYMEYMGM